MKIQLPYGHEIAEAEIGWGIPLESLDIADVAPIDDLPAATVRALMKPIGGGPEFFDIVKPGESLAIIVSDSFRHTGVDQLLPTILAELANAGMSEEKIFFVFATGTHRGPTEDEKARILGTEVYRRFSARAFTHDPKDPEGLVALGTTRRGTRVTINRRVHEADRVLVTGAVVFHYFAGFGGGRKSVVPGVAGVQTIAQNHALNLDPNHDQLDPMVRIGGIEGNPVAEDMAEAASLLKVDYLINTVMNRNAQIAKIFGGDIVAAHRAACDYARTLYATGIDELADLVIASAGAAKNFIQSHKALFNAYQAMKPGGRIIFLCPAPEGYGGNRFAEWVRLASREAIIAELRKNAEINGQTALSTIEKAPHSYFVTKLSNDEVAALGACKAGTLQQALSLAFETFRARGIDRPTYRLMPSAAYTVPFFQERSEAAVG